MLLLFKYKGIDLTGEMVDGYLESENKKSALYSLKREKDIVALIYIKRKIDNPVVNNVRTSIESTQKKITKKTLESKQIKKAKELSKRNDLKQGKTQPSILSKLKKFSLSNMFNKVNMPGIVINKTIYKNSADDYENQEFEQFRERNLAHESAGHEVIITRTSSRPQRKNLNDGKTIDWESLLPEEQTIEMKKNAKIKIKEKEIILFSKKLNMMLSSGVSLIRALTILKDTSNKKLKNVLDGVIDSVQRGHSLSVSMAQYPRQFDSVYVSMISIGETSGSLTKALKDVIYYKEKNMNLKKKLKSASIYPSVIGFVMVIFLLLGSIFFIPMFKDMFAEQGADLPFLTTLVFDIADKIPLLVFIAIIATIGVIALRKSNRSFNTAFKKIFDLILFKIPVIKTVISANYMFAFSSSIALMLENGIRIKDALILTQRSIKNLYIKSEIASASDLMMRGFSFSEAISKQPHFDSLLVSVLLTGEEAGKMSESLREISEYYDEEVNRQITNLMEIVQPVFILIIALIVAPVIIAVYLPILDLSSGSMLSL